MIIDLVEAKKYDGGIILKVRVRKGIVPRRVSFATFMGTRGNWNDELGQKVTDQQTIFALSSIETQQEVNSVTN